MKNLTHLQWFKYLANFVKVNILRNSLECLHIIFVSCFFSATILQYKKLKIEFCFSNESYNEEQEIGSITLLHYRQAVFSLSDSEKKLYRVCFINFFV